MLHRPQPDLRAAPQLRPRSGQYAPTIPAKPTMVGSQRFTFLNQERQCATSADWMSADVSKLWIYNLHYFDDLNATDASTRTSWHRDLLERWVDENSPGHGYGWEPYPTSRRIVNWIKGGLRRDLLSQACRESLAVQSRWLTQRMEYHLLGNHLLANAKALVYAGSFFCGPEADRWRERGAEIMSEQLREQVLPDGGHFELSTMYHAAVLEDLLDLVNISQAYGQEPPRQWLLVIASMFRWLTVMTHPDGDIAFFNDAAFGVAPRLVELQAYASRLGLRDDQELDGHLKVMEASGYVCAAMGAAYLLCDCGPVGPDYLPGHAHADTLSFELSIFGRRVFVNSGTSNYENDAERHRQRGTAAHNSVTVDGENSSEVWASFRVARRARAQLHAASSNSDSVIIEASHDGYRRFARHGEHRRRWTLDVDSLLIEDQIQGQFHDAKAHFHLHPDVDVLVHSSCELHLRWSGGCAKVLCDGARELAVHESTWHPHFGVTIASHCIVAKMKGPSLTTHIVWGTAE